MYTYKIKITSVYDGDTVNGTVDLGFNVHMDIKVRLARIDTPELRDKDVKKKELAYQARDFLRDIVKLYGDELIIQTTGKGKYGRWIGELYAQNMPHADMYKNEPEYETIANEIKNAMATGQDQTCNINDLMVSQGLAVYRDY